MDKLLDKQPERDAHSGKNAKHSNRAEKVKRTSEICQQKPDGNQVEKDAEGAGNSVVRISAFAVHVSDRHFANGSPVPGRESRNKTVQFAIKRNLLQDFAAICLVRSSKVVDINPAEFRHKPIGAARRDAA